MSAIAFKTVHGGAVSGVQRVTPEVLAAMERGQPRGPGPQPAVYQGHAAAGARSCRKSPWWRPSRPISTRTIPDRNRFYAVPYDWAETGLVRRWGFHGASHRYIAGRTAELLGRDDLRIISCHLGGSSSLCAIRNGRSVATSMGMSPQSGLPQNNRCGDFDPFALPLVMQQTGKSLAEVLDVLANQSGLLGLSGVERRLPRHRARRPRPATPGRSWPWTSYVRRAALPGGVPGRVGRGRRDRLYRRHRREPRRLPRARLRATWKNWASCSTPAANASARAKRRSCGRPAACRFGSCPPTKNWSSPGRPRNSAARAN